MMFAGYISDRARKRKPFIVFGYLVGRGAFFFIPFIRDFWTLLVMDALASMSFGVAMPIMRALQADLVLADIRGTIFGFQQLFFNSGIFFGALFGGWLANMYAGESFIIIGFKLSGYFIPFWLTASLGMLTTLLFVLFVKENG